MIGAIKKIISDPTGYMFRNYYSYKMRFVSMSSTLYSILIGKLKGIKIGENCKFYGCIHFERAPMSDIRIGMNCTFRSKDISNLIGINRRCIFSTLKNDAKIIIGDNCGFSGTVIGSFQLIEIGNNVMCGANTLITDSDWHPKDPRSGKPKPIIIENNVWLGEGVKVLKGVRIGENSVIGAGSVVVKDIPANVVAAGNPCKIIKEIQV